MYVGTLAVRASFQLYYTTCAGDMKYRRASGFCICTWWWLPVVDAFSKQLLAARGATHTHKNFIFSWYYVGKLKKQRVGVLLIISWWRHKLLMREREV